MNAFDVAIVGGGPAGSAAALALARDGRRVAVFERAPMPRDKICGDLLGTDAVALVARLGFGSSVLAGSTALGGAILHGPRGATYGAVRETISPRNGAACVLPRRIFDAALLHAAERAGACVRYERILGIERDATGAVIGVRTQRETVAARVTIAADGWGSVVARSLGADARCVANVAVAVRAYASDVRALGTRMRFFVNSAGDGYGWIFPIGDDRANVGLGSIRSEGAFDLHAAWARFIGPQSLAAPYLRGATLSAQAAWPIPLGPRVARTSDVGVFLAGDAAWLASPISGSGIANALASGNAAARYAMRALAGEAGAWGAYDAWIKRRIVRRLRIEAWAHATCGTPQSVDLYAFFSRLPGAGAILSRAMLALG